MAVEVENGMAVIRSEGDGDVSNEKRIRWEASSLKIEVGNEKCNICCNK